MRKSRKSVYNANQYDRVHCNFCTTVCSNYVAYKGHVWNNHFEEVEKQGNKMIQRPYDLDDNKGVPKQ